MKRRMAIWMAVIIMGILGACKNNERGDQSLAIGMDDSNHIRGTITMAGSTSMEKLANTAAEGFME